MTIDGAADGPACEAFVGGALRTLRPGQIVVMDNLSVQKGAAIAPIEGCGCRLLAGLPPDLLAQAPHELEDAASVRADPRGAGGGHRRRPAAIGQDAASSGSRRRLPLTTQPL